MKYQLVIFNKAQNSKNLRLNGHANFEFQRFNGYTIVIPSLEFKTRMTIKSQLDINCNYCI